MFLYGITGSFVIVLMLCLKGPLELFILSKLGLPLVESFEATIKGGGIQGWVKGGALLLILIIQPLLAGALFLKILDRFLQATVVTNTRKFGRLAPRKAGGKVKTEEDFKDRLQLRVREEPNIGAGTGGAALGAASFITAARTVNIYLSDGICDLCGPYTNQRGASLTARTFSNHHQSE